jgi:hypothetical protein
MLRKWGKRLLYGAFSLVIRYAVTVFCAAEMEIISALSDPLSAGHSFGKALQTNDERLAEHLLSIEAKSRFAAWVESHDPVRCTFSLQSVELYSQVTGAGAPNLYRVQIRDYCGNLDSFYCLIVEDVVIEEHDHWQVVDWGEIKEVFSPLCI